MITLFLLSYTTAPRTPESALDDGLAAVLSKMVRHHHKRRLQTAADALEVLQTLQQPVPAVASSDRTSHPTLCQPHEVANTDSDTAAAVPPQPDKAMPSASPSKTPTVRAVPQAITRAPVTTITSQPRPTVWRRSRWAVVGAAAIVLATAVPGIAYLMHTKNLSEHERQVLHLDDLQQDGQYGVCLETAAALPNMNETWTKAAQVIITKCETGKAQTDALEAIENFQSKGDLEACIEAAQDFPAPTTTALAEEAGQYLGRCQLSQARQLAQTGSFANGIAIANSIESESESYGEAQKLLAQWSYRILDLAEESYAKDGDMDTAETFIAAIPEQTAAYPTAQTTLAQLREDYERNQAALTAARNAFDEERWEDAIVAAGKLTLASTQVEKDYIITQSRKILSEEIEPFLDETSVLTTNRTGSFGRPYEEHTFDGEAGKTVVIMMESDQFDTLVQLIGPDGNEVARDDDRGRNDLNSSITIPLEASGTYLIRSQAYYRNGQGEYRLTARYLPEQ